MKAVIGEQLQIGSRHVSPKGTGRNASSVDEETKTNILQKLEKTRKGIPRHRHSEVTFAFVTSKLK